ncbi:MAG: MogA/MoaB family molybdenum cofactor biosynthesis protein [Ruminococcus sp.]|uniref:MogA/MoaB family molybdenum cofactor biosynthesis protein n=1 Tax=Ruminococcus sp. TaxID=41978 RepID=UPI002873946C|nr:MogA/MoaB family molybdenum cofactor biosynthesis protein [Ruminococcus sp.]MBQ3285987.1 MogA/MoaB family molybdenum cofactor biosynthesis protein [Ruminococcus sp.]
MYKASVITVSDRAANGIYEDQSGPAVSKMLIAQGYDVMNTTIISDEKNKIIETLVKECESGVHLIVTTGGTGFAPTDVTPEATKAVIEKEAPGIAEYMRQKSMEITPRGMLSRGIAGIRGNSLIINLPGSPKGATENLGFILPHLRHGLDMLNGEKE